MDALIIEASIVRAVLDQRTHVSVMDMPDLVDHVEGVASVHLAHLPTAITSMLVEVYSAGLKYLHAKGFYHPTAGKVDYLIDRMTNFYYFGKKSFIREWGYAIYIYILKEIRNIPFTPILIMITLLHCIGGILE
jgi:cobalamin-dependent methionine synthase I